MDTDADTADFDLLQSLSTLLDVLFQKFCFEYVHNIHNGDSKSISGTTKIKIKWLVFIT